MGLGLSYKNMKEDKSQTRLAMMLDLQSVERLTWKLETKELSLSAWTVKKVKLKT